MPAFPKDGVDIFTAVFQSIRHGGTDTMLSHASKILEECQINNAALFPNGVQTEHYVVVDEAQAAAKMYPQLFPSTSGLSLRPFLHPVYEFLWNSEMFDGIILSGTGLSTKIVELATDSLFAKRVPARMSSKNHIFTNTAKFGRNDLGRSLHETYICQFLRLSDNLSDRRLLERMCYWLAGRYACSSPLFPIAAHVRL